MEMSLSQARTRGLIAFTLVLLAACEHGTYEGGGRRNDLGDAGLGTSLGPAEGGSSGSSGASLDCSAGAAGELSMQGCP